MLQDSIFFDAIKYYSDIKQSPSIKKQIDIPRDTEEIKDTEVDNMLKLSNDLKQIKSRKEKQKLIHTFTINHVAIGDQALFLGIITFQVSLGITSYSIKKKSGELRFMQCVLGKKKALPADAYIDIKYDGTRVQCKYEFGQVVVTQKNGDILQE